MLVASQLVPTAIVAMILILIAPSARADDKFATTIRVGGIFTQFFFLADDDEGPTENLNPAGQFHYTRIYVDSRTNLTKSVYVRGYARLVVNNWSTVHAEQSYVEVGGPYGQLRAGAHKPFNEREIDNPAPQAALDVGDEIFSALVKPRTDIPQRYGLTFKRLVGRVLGVSYETPRINGLKLGVSYYPALDTTEGPTDRSSQSNNAVDVTGSYKVELMRGVLKLIGGYFRATSPVDDTTGTKAWNTSLQWSSDRWEIGGTLNNVRLSNGARDVAWVVGVLHRTGPWAFSTDYRSSNRRAAKGMPVGEYADRVMVQADYRLGPGISVGLAGFYAEQRDSENTVWRSKGGTVGIKLFF